MAQILQRIVNWLPDGALELKGETWCRKLPFGNNWLRIRLAIIATIGEGSVGYSFFGGQTMTAIGLFTGMCSSKEPFGLYSSSSAYGISWLGSSIPPNSAVLTLTAGGQTYPAYWLSNQSPYWFCRFYDPAAAQGSAFYEATLSGNAALLWPYNVAPRRRSLFVVDIFRNAGGGGTATNTIYYTTQANNAPDYSGSDLQELLTQAAGVCQGVAMYTTNNATQWYGEAFNALDAMFVHTTNSAVPIYIHAMGAACWAESMSPELGFDTQQGGTSCFMYAGTSSGTWPLPADSNTPQVMSLLSGLNGWDDITQWNIYGTNAYQSPIYGSFFGTMATMDTFTQYPMIPGNGSVAAGLLNAGTGWSGPWVDSPGTNVPYTKTVLGFIAGTSANMPWMDGTNDFVSFNGTIISGVYSVGTGWGGPCVTSGSWSNVDYNNSTYYQGNSGTSGAMPNDTFVQYTTGTKMDATMDAGTAWGSPFYFRGTNENDLPLYQFFGFDFASTAANNPVERFEQYNTGTLYTDVFITAGTWWAADGTSYAGIY